MFDVESTFEVPRVDRPSRRELEERFLGPHRPVVITGMMDDWPAFTRWTNDYLKEKVGERVVHPSRAHKGTHLYKPREKVLDNAQPMRLADYVDLLARGGIADGELYGAAFPIRTGLPELWDEVAFPPYVDRDKYTAVNLWIGPGDTFTPLHYDASDNFLTQIRGRKQVLLCPPREIAHLYPFPFNYVCHHISQVDVTAPDLSQFPAYARAERSLVALGPGEMLFIPFYWWHAVWGIEESASINYWWRPRAAELLQHPRQTARGLGRQVYVQLRGAARRVARRAGIEASI